MDALTQPDYVDGKILHLAASGGVVDLDDSGTTYRCAVSAEVADRLRPHVNGGTVRAFGTAEWLRYPDGRWSLQAFSIESFTPLDDKPLDQVLK
jgi:hypothetical protein